MSLTWNRLRRLKREEAWAFVQAWGVLLAADLGLRLLPYPKVESWLTPSPGAAPEEGAVARRGWGPPAAGALIERHGRTWHDE